MSGDRGLYSLDAAAIWLSVGKTKVEELVHDGVLETVYIGRRRLVPAEALDDYIKRLREAS